jgi:hypothetical protein
MRVRRMALSFLLSAAVVATVAPPARAEDLSAMRAELEAMRQRLAVLEADRADKRRVGAAAAMEAGDKPRSWKLPGTNTSMTIGGYVKLDAVWDLNAGGVGGDTTFAIAPNLDGNNAAQNRLNGGNWRLHARETRFRIQTWTPTDWGELTTYIETDFFGAGSVLRLRHAFGTLGPVLAGQTWTTFVPTFAVPAVLDFNGPVGFFGRGLRQGQVRYHHNFGGGWEAQIAAEDPGTDTVFLGTGQGAQRFPDVVANLSYHFPGGRLWIAGVVRGIEQDGGTAAIPTGHAAFALGWGFSAAAVYEIRPGRWKVGAYGAFGQGIGAKYMGNFFQDAVWSGAAGATTNTLRAVWAGFGAVWTEWQWTDTIKSVVAFSYGFQDMKRATVAATDAAKEALLAAAVGETWSLHGNVQWSPVAAVTFGAEYMYFHLNRIGAANSSIHRLQFSAVYRF